MRNCFLGAAAALLVLAGCGFSSPAISFVRASAVSPASGSSGVLIYVSDWRNGRVLFFNYPSGSLAGTIADSQFPPIVHVVSSTLRYTSSVFAAIACAAK